MSPAESAYNLDAIVYLASVAKPAKQVENAFKYFPKKTDFRTVTFAKLKEVQEALNNRPRKKLGFFNPK